MKHLVDFRVFESAGPGLTQEQEEFLNEFTKGRWSYDPKTGLVDVAGDFDCRSKRLKTLSGVKFGKVSGNFDCSWNELTSLEGSPQKVGGSFDCSHNRLTSLERAPQEVGGEFVSWNNEIPEWLSQRIYVIMKNRVNLRIGLALLKKEILDAKQKEIDSINSKYDTFLIEDEDLVKGVSMLNNFGHFD